MTNAAPHFPNLNKPKKKHGEIHIIASIYTHITVFFFRIILILWRRLGMLKITSTWRVAGMLTQYQHVGRIWRSLSAVRLQLSLVCFTTSPLVTATRNHSWFPISKIIWTWVMWNLMTYPSSVLLTLQLWVMIRSLLNLLHKIKPYSMTMRDLHWSQRSLLKTTKTIVLTLGLN